MPRTLKIVLIVVGALVALLAVALAIVAATFNLNDYKPLAIRKVQEATQRTLVIPDDISLSFFPKIGVKLGKASLSERQSEAVFASVESARVSLALMPLLRKEVVVDRISVAGLKADVRRFKDGRTSVDDLLSPAAAGGQEPAAKEQGASQGAEFDIGGISVSNANIAIEDEKENRSFSLINANIETDRIAPGHPGNARLSGHVKARNPDVDAQFDLKTGYLLEIKDKHYAFKGLSAEVTGRLAGVSDLKAKLAGNVDVAAGPLRLDVADVSLSAQGRQGEGTFEAVVDVPKLTFNDKDIAASKIDGKATLVQGPRTVKARLAVPSFEGSAQAFKIPQVAVEADIDEAALHAKAGLSGAVEGDVTKMLFSSPQLKLTLDGKQGEVAIKGEFAATFKADVANKNVAATLDGRLDQGTVNAKLGVNGFSPPGITFDVAIDQINVDRYRAAAAAKSKEGASKPGAQEADAPIDVSALQKLNAKGSVRVGSLQVAGLKASNVRMDLHAANGKVDVSPLSANLYKGSVAGGLSVAATTPPRFTVKQTLSNVSIGPLLKDMTGKDSLEGQGSVVLDIATQGATVKALRKGLNGNARAELRDGSVRGINVAQAIRNAKARLGGGTGQQAGSGSQNEKADFSELSGSFKLANGVAHNEDLSAKSPLLRVAGNGDIDIGEGKLDYLVKATVVATLQGQGGPELQALRGQTIPVRLTGPFDAIGYRIDFAALAQGAVKQKVEERKEQIKEKLQDRLKGLFGK